MDKSRRLNLSVLFCAPCVLHLVIFSAQMPPASGADSRFAKARKIPLAAAAHTATANAAPTGTGTGGARDLQTSFENAMLAVVLDPINSFWTKLPSSKIDLYPQSIVTPHGGGSIKELQVKFVRLAEGVAVHLEWPDATKDNDTVRQQCFRDAVAVQFPIGEGEDTVLAMGSPRVQVNIWQWKSDWEFDAPKLNVTGYAGTSDDESPRLYGRMHVDSSVEANAAQGAGPTSGLSNIFPQDAHQSPVEDIVAAGISTISTKSEQNLRGRGIWLNGRWHVVIYRPYNKKDMKAADLAPGKRTNVAFAVWNGSQRDRNGMKSVSNWLTLSIK